MKNKSVVIAKVTEILPDNVKYQKFGNLDGPSYTALKADVSRIVYHNGTIDEFSDTEINQKKPEKINYDRQMHAIFLAGITLSTLGGDANNSKYKQGIAAGFGIDFPFDPSGNYFELSLNYEQKGAGFADSEQLYHDELYLFTETVLDMEYLSLSFMYKQFFGAKKIFYAKAGLYAGFRVSGDYASKLIKVSNNTEEYYTGDMDGVYSKMEGGATFGAGLNIPITKGDFPTSLIFEGRYNLGLSNIYSKESLTTSEKYREINQNFLILAGLRFPI